MKTRTVERCLNCGPLGKTSDLLSAKQRTESAFATTPGVSRPLLARLCTPPPRGPEQLQGPPAQTEQLSARRGGGGGGCIFLETTLVRVRPSEEDVGLLRRQQREQTQGDEFILITEF